MNSAWAAKKIASKEKNKTRVGDIAQCKVLTGSVFSTKKEEKKKIGCPFLRDKRYSGQCKSVSHLRAQHFRTTVSRQRLVAGIRNKNSNFLMALHTACHIRTL